MNYKLLTSMALLSCTFITTASTLNSQTAPSDPGVINKDGIVYWMIQRGELSANATDAEKRQAISNYLGKKSFQAKKLPGEFGKQYLFEQSLAYEERALLNMTRHSGKTTAAVLNKVSAKNAITEAKVLALMIDFPDHQADEATYPASHYNDLLFLNTGAATDITSVYKYYQAESGGTLNFTGSVNGWVRAANDAAHYGGNDPDNNDDDKNVPALVLEAVNKAVSELEIDLKDYDLDNDGIIDHVMIFHSSTGEEAGGGELGEDAIWSHSYVVADEQGQPVSVDGSDVKLYGYTINPIDARIGVVSHEFGHDLGVPDEYDTDSGTFGSPVGDWSIMASGSWVDGGAHPSGFSPFARDYFQTRYGGNWINQQEVTFADLSSQSIDLVRATDHSIGVNQVKVTLPVINTELAPYSGEYQFYSSQGHDLNSALSFDVALPAGSSTLTMKAHWNIELDWDYLVVKVNDTVIAGNHTTENNPLPELPDVHHYISGSSKSLENAQGELGWVDLTFDLSAYENQTVTVKIEYITDTYVSEYGFVADEITVTNGDESVFFADAESDAVVDLTGGFVRSLAWELAGAEHHYFVQLRDHSVTDKFLKNENYDHGVVVWYRDLGVSDNRVNAHPGEVFIGVVDADQNPVKQGSNYAGTASQISDAAFSRYDQQEWVNGDSHLSAISLFDDRLDYSAPYQPESGIKLPKLGLTMEVTAQHTASETATINLVKSPLAFVEAQQNGLTVAFSVNDDEALAESTYVWQMGDNTTLNGENISYSYASAGEFDVSVTYQTNSGENTLFYTVVVGDVVLGDFSTSITDKKAIFTPELTGGFGDFSYRWDFGDNSNISNEMNPTHDYADYGSYTVTLTVVDDTSQSFVFTKQVNIENVLSASFIANTNNLVVNFVSSVTGGDESYSYLWDFGDGASSTSSNPSHTYTAAGSYNVVLTVTDDSGQSAQYSSTVNVTAAVVTPPVTENKSSGGGALGYWLLMLTASLFVRRKS